MRINILIAVLIGLCAYGLTLYFDHTELPVQIAPVDVGVKLDNPLPEFSFTTPDGKTHAIKDFKDKIIILNFWASWCRPCIVEFPKLLKLAKTYEQDAVLIALSSDIDEASMKKFLEKLRQKENITNFAPNIFIAIDENARITHDLFQTFKLPETLLIDKAQNIRHKLVGSDWEEKDAAAQIKALK